MIKFICEKCDKSDRYATNDDDWSLRDMVKRWDTSCLLSCIESFHVNGYQMHSTEGL